ncbi:MAG: DUF6960 family protein [Lacipirellulaceae bacterium]
MPDEPLPPLKVDPKHGYYPWWPEDGDAWVHPEDVALARRTIPGPRVWRRDGVVPAESGEYVVLHYGADRLRVRRTLWREAPFEGFSIGDWVEVRPRGLKNEPHTGHVREVWWDDHEQAVRYWITTADGTALERAFEADDLKHVEPTKPAEVARLEPSGAAPGLELADP